MSTVPSALRSSTLSLVGSGLPMATQLMMGSEPRLNSSSEASWMIWGNRSGTQKSTLGLALLLPYKKAWHLFLDPDAASLWCQGKGDRCCGPALIPTPHAGLSNILSTDNDGIHTRCCPCNVLQIWSLIPQPRGPAGPAGETNSQWPSQPLMRKEPAPTKGGGWKPATAPCQSHLTSHNAAHASLRGRHSH